MENISLSVTNSLSLLHKLFFYYKDKYTEIKSLYDKICNIDKKKDDYAEEVRKLTKKYCKDFDKEYNKMVDIHDTFIKDIKIIQANKSDDRVIYNVDKYREYVEELYKFNKKKIEYLHNDLEDDVKIYLYESNYPLASNTRRLLVELMEVESFIKLDLTYLDKFNKKKKDKGF